MALHLILRNSTKIRGLNLQKTVIKYSPIITANNSLWTQTKQQTPLIKQITQSKLGAISLPPKRSMSGDHGKLWAIERYVAIGLLAIIPLDIATPSGLLDMIVAIASVVHVHWGFEAIAIDYVRPVLFGNVIPGIALGFLYVVSAIVLGGLMYYNAHDIGIGRTIRKLWSVRPPPPPEPAPEEEQA